MVFLGVGCVANADHRGLEKLDDGCEHLRPSQPRRGHVGRHPSPQPRENLGEPHEVFELRLVPRGAELLMIAVLLAAALVETDGLDVSDRIGADPPLQAGGITSRRIRSRTAASLILAPAESR